MSDLIIRSQKQWIEGNAEEQLRNTAQLPGMISVRGMPDLHPGKGSPIGAAFASTLVYPHLVDKDIGCGMAFWQTELKRRKFNLDKGEKRLKDVEGPWDGDVAAFLAQEGVQPTTFDTYSLGTIGKGNHFAEVQQIIKVENSEIFESLGLDEDLLFILVHSGSRGFGESILYANSEKHANRGLSADSPEGQGYLTSHDHAMRWAKANRKLIGHRFMERLSTEGKLVLDVCHNCVKRAEVDGQPCWLHRKGAAPSNEGPVVIPGSRGTASYLVVSTGEHQSNLASLAHGAGRKMMRSECIGKLRPKYKKDELRRTALGGRVICDDKNLLYEEAPEAYKNIHLVVQDLVDAGLVTVVATFAPLISYKVREERDEE